MLGATVPTLVAGVTWYPGFVHPWSRPRNITQWETKDTVVFLKLFLPIYT